MRIRTIAYLGHKDTLSLSTIKKHGPNQPLNQQINVLASSALARVFPCTHLVSSGQGLCLCSTATHWDKQQAKGSLAVLPQVNTLCIPALNKEASSLLSVSLQPDQDLGGLLLYQQ